MNNKFLLLCLLPLSAGAQAGEDFMRSSGKIHVVYGVILIIFAGLFAYLIRLDLKIKKLENKQ